MSDKELVMDTVFSTIKNRRSTRRYEDRQVEKETLDKIVEAGRYAPSGGNSQSSHFIVVQNKEVIDAIVATVQSEFAKMEYDENTYKALVTDIKLSRKGTYVFHYGAPTLVVALNKKNYDNAMADTACAVENMMIMATAAGVDSCWTNQLHWLDDNVNMRELLSKYGLSEDETICCTLSLGYEKKADGSGERAPLERKGNIVTYVD